MEESPKTWGSTAALHWPRGVNQGARPARQDRSCNEVVEGQIKSLRDRPRTWSSRGVHGGTRQGPNFTAWFWCWGDAGELGWEQREPWILVTLHHWKAGTQGAGLGTEKRNADRGESALRLCVSFYPILEGFNLLHVSMWLKIRDRQMPTHGVPEPHHTSACLLDTSALGHPWCSCSHGWSSPG